MEKIEKEIGRERRLKNEVDAWGGRKRFNKE